MPKIKQKSRLQKRDWVIVLLFFITLTVGGYAYQVNQARELGEKAAGESWLRQQVQIDKLKACLNEDIKPCDTTPLFEQ